MTDMDLLAALNATYDLPCPGCSRHVGRYDLCRHDNPLCGSCCEREHPNPCPDCSGRGSGATWKQGEISGYLSMPYADCQTCGGTGRLNEGNGPVTDQTSGGLAAALAAFQAEMPTVPKNQKAKVPTKAGGSYEYTYAGLPDVSAAVMPLLSKHGLAFSVCPRITDHGGEVAGVLLHTSGERLEASLPLFGRQAQEIGSALTYARRYLLGCMTGVVTDDDDDGSLAQAAKRTEPPMTARTRGQLFALFTQKGVAEDQQLAGINHITQGGYTSRGDLTEAHAKQVIAALKQRPDAPPVDPTAEDAFPNKADQ